VERCTALVFSRHSLRIFPAHPPIPQGAFDLCVSGGQTWVHAVVCKQRDLCLSPMAGTVLQLFVYSRRRCTAKFKRFSLRFSLHDRNHDPLECTGILRTAKSEKIPGKVKCRNERLTWKQSTCGRTRHLTLHNRACTIHQGRHMRQ